MCRIFVFILLSAFSLRASAQYNVEKMMDEGRRSLDQGYYVVAMQIFSRMAEMKPYMYEAWYLSALSKYHLDDFKGAEQDCDSALALEPFVADIFDLHAMARIRQAKYDSAAVDYTHAIELEKNNRNFWFNRAYCFYMCGDTATAIRQLDYIIGRWKSFDAPRQLLSEIRSGARPTPSVHPQTSLQGYRFGLITPRQMMLPKQNKLHFNIDRK